MKTQYFKFMLPIACLFFLAATSPANARTSADESKPNAGPESSLSAYNQSSLDDEVLDFRLMGTAVSADPDQTLAIIQEGADRQQKFIHEGASIGEIESEKLSASLADINKVMQQVNLNPVAVYGRSIGARISPIEPGSIFAELGLKIGDIITAVNGQEIRKPEEAIALFERFRSGGDFDLSIRGSRRDKEIELIVK